LSIVAEADRRRFRVPNALEVPAALEVLGSLEVPAASLP
jgi:hypothetical protein